MRCRGSRIEISRPYKDEEGRGEKGKPQKPRRRARPDEIVSGEDNGESEGEMKHKNKYIDRDCKDTIRYSERGEKKKAMNGIEG